MSTTTEAEFIGEEDPAATTTIEPGQPETPPEQDDNADLGGHTHTVACSGGCHERPSDNQNG